MSLKSLEERKEILTDTVDFSSLVVSDSLM